MSNHRETIHIRLNTRLCKACWECVQICPQDVIGKVDLPFHRHARIDQAENCKGCLLCLEACPNQAISTVEELHTQFLGGESEIAHH